MSRQECAKENTSIFAIGLMQRCCRSKPPSSSPLNVSKDNNKQKKGRSIRRMQKGVSGKQAPNVGCREGMNR